MFEKIKALVQKNDTCVLATVSSKGEPHCSLMSYTAAADGTEIYMITLRQTKKYRNLLENTAVSLLIDTRTASPATGLRETKALTITGTFQTIKEETRKKKVQDLLLKKHSELSQFAQNPEAELFAVRVNAYQLLEGLTDSYYIALD